MKKIVFSLFVIGLGFTANAQKTEAAVHPSELKGSTVKDEKATVVDTQADATAEARISEMRVAVKNLEMRKQAISEDKTLTPAARKAKMEELYAEHDKLSKKLKTEAAKN